MSADLKVWRNLFKTVIVVDPLLSSRFEEEENASARGVERMQEMMEETFVNFSSSQAFIADALKSLKLSLDKARELYFRLLLLPVELTRLQEQNLDAARHKYIVTDEDLNPNMRFVDNQMVEALTNQADFMDEVEDGKLTWLTDNRMLLSALLKKITASNIYKEYMSAPTTDFKADCRLWRDLFKNVILPSEDLAEALEDKSVYWNDDIDTIGTFVLKTFRRLEEGVDQPILPQYKDAEDARFGEELFRAVVKNKEEYRALINDAIHTDSWDTERLAFMDVVIALTAIAELLNFPKIPVVVTVNEYIEMAKSYSTPKSGFFINGVVGGVIKRLQEEGKLNKAN
jgi:N utilization substance protein B